MITFAPFPTASDYGGYHQPIHPDDALDDTKMQLNEDFYLTDGSRLTCPGEPLTSSQDYMR
jgi:exosome complex component RRP4